VTNPGEPQDPSLATLQERLDGLQFDSAAHETGPSAAPPQRAVLVFDHVERGEPAIADEQVAKLRHQVDLNGQFGGAPDDQRLARKRRVCLEELLAQSSPGGPGHVHVGQQHVPIAAGGHLPELVASGGQPGDDPAPAAAHVAVLELVDGRSRTDEPPRLAHFGQRRGNVEGIDATIGDRDALGDFGERERAYPIGQRGTDESAAEADEVHGTDIGRQSLEIAGRDDVTKNSLCHGMLPSVYGSTKACTGPQLRRIGVDVARPSRSSACPSLS
jgi:hypothetical protein